MRSEVSGNPEEAVPRRPMKALRVYGRRDQEVEIPASLILANDTFCFDPVTRTLTLTLLVNGVEVVDRD